MSFNNPTHPQPASKLQTARNITIGNKTKSFDGSSNISFSLDEIGAGGGGTVEEEYVVRLSTSYDIVYFYRCGRIVECIIKTSIPNTNTNGFKLLTSKINNLIPTGFIPYVTHEVSVNRDTGGEYPDTIIWEINKEERTLKYNYVAAPSFISSSSTGVYVLTWLADKNNTGGGGAS